MPCVSVIMPAHNAGCYIEEAVRSLQAQTLGDFEFIIIDDGSMDETGAILEQMAAKDGRLQVVHQANQRIVATLNRGCMMARGEFVAIMHADDVALPERLATQVGYLQNHADIQLCGTWMETFHERDGRRVSGRAWHYPTDPDFIACFLLFWCCLAHPSVMLRASTFQRDGLRYDPRYNHAAEDYGLWASCAARFRIGNVPEVLLHYREHAAQGSQVYKTQQRAETRMIRLGMLERLGLAPTADQMDLHQKLAESELEASVEFVGSADAWLRQIFAANLESGVLPEIPLGKVLAGRWVAVCRAANNVPDAWGRFWQSHLAGYVDLSQEKNRDIPGRPGTAIA